MPHHYLRRVAMATVDRISVWFGTKVPGRHDYSNIEVGAGVEASLVKGENPEAVIQEMHEMVVLLVRQQVVDRLSRRPASERTGTEAEDTP